jgi:hypothetical protein
MSVRLTHLFGVWYCGEEHHTWEREREESLEENDDTYERGGHGFI